MMPRSLQAYNDEIMKLRLTNIEIKNVAQSSPYGDRGNIRTLGRRL